VDEWKSLPDMIRRELSFPAHAPAATRPVPYPFHMLYGALVRPAGTDI